MSTATLEPNPVHDLLALDTAAIGLAGATAYADAWHPRSTIHG